MKTIVKYIYSFFFPNTGDVLRITLSAFDLTLIGFKREQAQQTKAFSYILTCIIQVVEAVV